MSSDNLLKRIEERLEAIEQHIAKEPTDTLEALEWLIDEMVRLEQAAAAQQSEGARP